MDVDIFSYLIRASLLLQASTGYLQVSLSYGKVISHIPSIVRIIIVYVSVFVMFLYTLLNYLRLGKFSFFRTFAFPARSSPF